MEREVEGGRVERKEVRDSGNSVLGYCPVKNPTRPSPLFFTLATGVDSRAYDEEERRRRRRGRRTEVNFSDIAMDDLELDW